MNILLASANTEREKQWKRVYMFASRTKKIIKVW